MDFVQLNYWNANPDYKRMNLRTYIVDPVNYNLKAARNFKWEVRLGHGISQGRSLRDLFSRTHEFRFPFDGELFPLFL